MGNRNIIIAAVAVIVVVLVIVLWPSSDETLTPVVNNAPPIVELVVPPEPVVVQIEAIEPLPVQVDLPLAPRILSRPSNLDESDEKTRTAGADLSVRLGRLLLPVEQIRKWVVFIDRSADGELLSKHRPWVAKLGEFVVDGGEEAPVMAKDNYRRYDRLVGVMNTVPVEKFAYYLVQWQTLFDEAYSELGRSGEFNERLLLALDQVIAAEALTVKPALVRPSVMYKYADVRLESASDIQKLLWRIGPQNQADVQQYAQQLRKALIAPPEYQSD